MKEPCYEATYHANAMTTYCDYSLLIGSLSKDGVEPAGVHSMALDCTGICQAALLLQACDLDGDVKAPVLEDDLSPGGQAADVAEVIALADACSP